MAAPLIIGSNVLHITPFDLETYKNTEVIAIDQDTLGLQGELVWEACANADTVSSLLGLPSRPFKDEDYLYPRSGGGGGGSGGGRKEQQQLPDLGPHRQVGSKGNVSPPVPPCQHIWLKKLVDGYALAFVNYTYINATIKNGHNVVHGQGDGDVDGGGGDEGVAAAMAPKPFLHAEGGDQTSSHGELALVACNASDPAQLWNLTVDGTATTIKISVDTEGPLKSPACWEIDACNYNAGASVDTKYGCRPVPKPGDKVCARATQSRAQSRTHCRFTLLLRCGLTARAWMCFGTYFRRCIYGRVCVRARVRACVFVFVCVCVYYA